MRKKIEGVTHEPDRDIDCVRDRKHEGLRVCRAAWLVGVTVREYREMEAGDRVPEFDVWDRLCELYGWPRSFVDSPS
jgi:hypothetical protein